MFVRGQPWAHYCTTSCKDIVRFLGKVCDLCDLLYYRPAVCYGQTVDHVTAKPEMICREVLNLFNCNKKKLNRIKFQHIPFNRQRVVEKVTLHVSGAILIMSQSCLKFSQGVSLVVC